MDEETKKKLLENLKSNPLYQKSLRGITNPAEKEKAQALAEDVYIKLLEGLGVMKKVVEQNPEKMAEVASKRIDKK